MPASDIADINFGVRRDLQASSTQEDYILLKSGPVPCHPVFVAAGDPIQPGQAIGMEGPQNYPRILAIRDSYEAVLKAHGYNVVFEEDQRGNYGPPATAEDLALWGGIQGRTLMITQGHPVFVYAGYSTDHGACLDVSSCFSSYTSFI